MKSKIKLVLFGLYILSSALSFSCNKKKEGTTIKTNTELLTTGTWKYIACIISPAYDYYGDGNIVTDIFSILKPCERDDFETFKTNGIWEYNEGPTKCDPSYPQVFSDPWRFADNETRLLEGSVEHTILELTETTLKLRYTFEDAGVTYTEVDTYRH